MAYWYDSPLQPEDRNGGNWLAWPEKLRYAHSDRKRTPEMHLLIYRRLDNPFVLGLLEAYWDAYEAVGLNLYTDYFYLEEVWGYHQRMVDGIISGDLEAGYQALLEHTDLLHHRVIRPENGMPLIKNIMDKNFSAGSIPDRVRNKQKE
jgi:hypothetical protein